MPEPERTHGGTRVYHDEQLQQLVFVKRSRELGFGLEEIREQFSYSFWLNPITKSDWDFAWGRQTIRKVGEVFHMEDLTLDGLKNAVEYLSIKRV